MRGVELVVILLAVSAALRLVARRLRVPHPVLLVLAGLALVFVPGLPRVELDPDALFLLFVPPLLYWGALTTSLRDFRLHFWPIARFGTLVVLLTIVAVAVVAHALTPEFSWPAAFTLAAIVSPPDPVAAIAVMRTIGARPASSPPSSRAKGLVNDATALVAYRVAIGAAVTGVLLPRTRGRRLPPDRHGRRGDGPRRRLAHRPGPPPGARLSHRGEHHLPAHALLRLSPRRVARAAPAC